MDTAVSLRGVWKTYRQRQRSARLRDVLQNLLHPTVVNVDALRGVEIGRASCRERV